ncbi:ABC transporter permease [Georgenia sp. Z1491]|uniref:ABC transporter permease n=1 Tax=Georgenia sp. Z1491 TaxID=3416707 RepID=UPI003CF694EB
MTDHEDAARAGAGAGATTGVSSSGGPDATVATSAGADPRHLAMAAAARRWGWWYQTEAWLRSFRYYAFSALMYAVGQPLVYMIAMGIGLGTLVGQGAGTVDGVDYLTFVAPAILVSTAVMSVTGEMTYPVMTGFKWQRLYHAPAATAMSPGHIAHGHFVGVMLRFAAQCLVFWLIMLAFGATSSPASVLLVPIGVLAAAAFGAPVQAYASTLEDEGFQFSAIQRFVVMPMFLFAGTFFPLTVMPVYLQWIGWLSPVWHGSQLARVVSYGADVAPWLIAAHVAFLVACTALGLVWSRRSYTRRLSS